MEQIETKKAQLSATMGDQQIIQLFFQRCEEAITQTQKKYGALCRSVAQRLLTDPRDTEECVSDTYLRVWNAIPPERPRSLRAYLARITRNLALDRYNYNTAAQRSTALTDAFEELEPWIVAGQGDPDTELDASELRRVLNGFLRRQSAEIRVFFCAATGTERASGRLRKNAMPAKEKLKHRCSAHGNSCARNWNRKGLHYERNSFSEMDERRG